MVFRWPPPKTVFAQLTPGIPDDPVHQKVQPTIKTVQIEAEKSRQPLPFAVFAPITILQARHGGCGYIAG
jgi:hypothetical protein